MARPIRANEGITQGLRRSARADLADARDSIRDPKVEFAERIHSVRTAIKKVRAETRMVRPRVRRAAKENRRLRKIARSVGALREAEVLVGTYDSLLRDGGAKPSRRKLRGYLADRLRQATREFDGRHGFDRLGRDLARARRRAKRWTSVARKAGTAKDHGWTAIDEGVVEEYARARQRMADAQRMDTPEAFHAWRRSAKTHRHQLHALREIWPQELPDRIDELDRLGDLLGEEHDLSVLESTLLQAPQAILDPRERGTILERLRRSREQRRAHAKALGARLFRESPSIFERRLKAAFEALPG